MSSMQSVWEKRATVRSRPRIILDKEQTGQMFPITHQPIAVHPKISAMGEEALNYLLTQSLYLYAHDIASIETRFVNQGLLYIITQSLPVRFTEEQQLDAYLIMTDEAYHAYVAFDMMAQVQAFTNTAPLPMPADIQISLAFKETLPSLDKSLHTLFHLVAICIAENTLTEEIVCMIKKTQCHPSILKMFKDHLSDEARHALYFQALLKYLWQILDATTKSQLSKILPGFIRNYLAMTAASQFFYPALIKMGFNDKQATQILHDSYESHMLTATHPMISSIMKLLQQANVLEDDEVKKQFLQLGWLS